MLQMSIMQIHYRPLYLAVDICFLYIYYVCGNNFLCCSHRLLGVYYAEAIWTKQYLPWCRRIIYVDLMLTNSYVLLLSVYYLGKEWTKLA